MRTLVASVALLLSFVHPASAIEVNPTADPQVLLGALLNPASGLTVKNVIVRGAPEMSGTYTNLSALFQAPAGILLSTGKVKDYGDGPNQFLGHSGTLISAEAESGAKTLLDQVTGGNHTYFDVAQFEVVFDAGPESTKVAFDLVFGTEEFPDTFNAEFTDGFGAFLNGENFALVDGLGITAKHPKLSAEAGTELNGLLGGSTAAERPFVHHFEHAVAPNSTDNHLVFIVGDTNDWYWDTTVYLSELSD